MTTWRKVERIKTTGQAEIWLATNTDTDEIYVMKRLLRTPQLDEPDRELKRFRREVRCQKELDHPNIMPIIGWNFKSDPPFYIMPRASRSLQDVINSHPAGLDEEDSAEIMITVAGAIEYAHSEGVLHRDLKPANILDLDGEWVVADFGLCRDIYSDSTTITRTESVVGTVAYLAPEQYDDAHQSGAQADVYSLGKILYHCLTGRVPFPTTKIDLVPAKFRYLVARCMAEDPEDRYRSVAEFQRELEMLMSRSDSFAPPARAAKDLVQAVLSSRRGAVSDLTTLLLENGDDEALQKEVVGGLPVPVLRAIMEENGVAFEQIVKGFDRYSEGGHPFSYTDQISDFFVNVFNITKSPMLRKLCLERILEVGYEHNRFYVRTAFMRLLAKLVDAQDVQLAATVLKEHASAASWIAEDIGGTSLPRVLRDLLKPLEDR